jgi:LmbE family N-acetylglucosaminyl deacetylase
MRALYIYPHPDDESFGPASIMAKQRRLGHEVHLLTLTRGGATKVRHRFGLDVERMGELRTAEMRSVAAVLDLNGLNVLDLPDGRLKEIDPRIVEDVVAAEIRRVRPHVVVTYPVHGVSGFHDHLVTHAVVKRVFLTLRAEMPELQRLAMITLSQESAAALSNGPFRLSGSTPEEIDCVEQASAGDIEKNREALRCYVSYMRTIEQAGVIESRESANPFELFDERHDPPLADLFAGLRDDDGARHAPREKGRGR